jgi:hypothetical protein
VKEKTAQPAKERKMTMRELEYIRKLKRQIAVKCAKRTREWKKKAFEDVIAKEKIETYGDIFGIFYGLSKRAIEVAALNRIEVLAGMGYSPARIIGVMEVKKEKKNEKIDL